MAGTFKEREARATLSHMAKVWLRLAARQPTQPVFQQQQQIQPKNDKVGRVGGESGATRR